MILALTGATGFVGQALLDRALAEGLTVRALVRRSQPPREGVEWIAGDLNNRAALDKLVDRAGAVIHVAGVVNAPDAAGFETGNVTGTMNVVEAAVAARVPRFIHVSSLSAREPQLSTYGGSKLRGERVVKSSPLDWSVVRPPAIYGPRDTEVFELFKLAKRGVVPLPPPGKLSVIHVDDLARLLLALIPTGEDVTHKVFEPDDGKPGGWSHASFAKAIGWALGKRITPVHLPAALLRLGARADGMIRRGKAKLTHDRVGYMVHPDWTVSEAGAIPPAIWRPQIATRSGLKDTAQWYAAQGWL